MGTVPHPYRKHFRSRRRRTPLRAASVIPTAPSVTVFLGVESPPSRPNTSRPMTALRARRTRPSCCKSNMPRLIAGTREAVWNLLTKGLDAVSVSIVHFAGHGDFPLGVASLSSLKLQDATLTVLEVAAEVRLGRKSGCLVIFNACETGATGSVLAGVGGWAQAILQQRFGGFIAPLWAVDDDDAAIVASDLFDALVNAKRPVAQALLSIRQRYGAKSPTYLAYLFYSDVGAHIGS